jgi:predicted cupin superfamily sugar epimerase
MSSNFDELVRALSLAPHPEGGFFRQTFRSPLTVPAHGGTRAASTAIYYLLPAGELSALHRVRSDEIWHWYAGSPLTFHRLDDDGGHRVTLLGGDVARGQEPQVIVPADTWQAAQASPDGWSLCGCTVAPGFDFADWELPSRSEAQARFPQRTELIARLTRPAPG